MKPSEFPPLGAELATMYRIRFLEEKITALRKTQEIQGSIHLCNGQEAIYVGARKALRDDDYVFSTYRGHGWAVACGVPCEAIFAELLGRETGVCHGRGGSAFFSAPDWGFYGENSIVAAGTAIACGAALTAKLAGRGQVALTAVGDGAMNQGAMHESMNFSAYLNLPVVFICENNTYAELTPLAETVRVPAMYRRGVPFGIQGERVDGNDLEAVRTAVARHVERARSGEGPGFLELMTHRLVGHYYGDMQSYRPTGELAAAKKDEPILRLRELMMGKGVTIDVLDAIAASVQTEIEDAARRALAAPLADANTVHHHLYEAA